MLGVQGCSLTAPSVVDKDISTCKENLKRIYDALQDPEMGGSALEISGHKFYPDALKNISRLENSVGVESLHCPLATENARERLKSTYLFALPDISPGHPGFAAQMSAVRALGLKSPIVKCRWHRSQGEDDFDPVIVGTTELRLLASGHVVKSEVFGDASRFNPGETQ